MELETMPRRGRRAVALAVAALAAVVTLAGCNGDGKGSGDSAASTAKASASASASVSASPQAPTPSGAPSAGAATASPSDQAPTGGTPTPAEPAPGRPSTAATPPVNGIAPGEPDPAGTGPANPNVRPPVSYRVDGGNKLTVYFFGGVCTTYAVKADESKSGEVGVVIVPGPPTVQPGHVCTAMAKRQAVSVDLRSPLAGRTVVDRTSGQEVPLEGDAHAGPDPVTPDGAAR
ncbi:MULTISPECIES: hypothetical protein [Kitasatospora]|uniref:Lipoprotein n=1 Tax=Kitasatospora cathayae TaxID=3004092 RepID=A0ABY7Q9V7_9ACTN|nr:hypothetical protein [Kitasatospora sp. HUAS 3-15]WBP89224.1 hypothetical protein O1G21_27525 [Kitasatospora sp. HUAS 3-15]